MSGAERRDSIMDAAIDEFTRVGYQGATIARIAAAAGCSEPNLYKHFRDKRGLLVACLEHSESLVEGELDKLTEHEDPLPEFLRIVRGSTAYRRMLLLRMLCTTLRDDPGILEHLGAGTDRLLQRWSRAIEHGKAAGRFPASLDAEHVGWTWLGLSLAASHATLVDGPGRFDEVMGVGERYLRDITGAGDPQ